MRHLALVLSLLPLAVILGGCESGGGDSFTYWLDRYGVAGGCLGSYIGGLLVSLTPCVYPMIAITVSVFGANPTQSRRKAMLLSLFFVLGITAMYTPLGVAAGITGDLFGAALASPWVLGSVVVLLVALAASMFGLWELALPASVQTRLSSVGGVGSWGAFLMGLVAGLLAAPCAGPVTIALLTFVGTSRDPVQGALFFFMYSLGVGTLFFLVGTFALSLPRSGRWMESVKRVFGVVILVAAAYYLTIIFPEAPTLLPDTHWLVPFLASGGLVAVSLVTSSVVAERLSGWKLKTLQVGAVALAAAGALGGIVAYSHEEELIAWRDDYEAADREARGAGRPMVIDFTAEWCGACQRLSRETFNDPGVASEAARFTPIRVDATTTDDRVAGYMERYEVLGLPTVVIIGPDGQERARLTEFVPPDEMLGHLRAAEGPRP